MKRILPLFLLLGGVVLFAIAFMFYQKSESIKSETDALQNLTVPSANSYENEAVYVPEPEPEYDPTDLDQTPPGITPFITTSVCLAHWGNQLRQYCDGGDKADLEIVEGGDQAESMRTLKMCLNDLVQRWETYKTDDRPMDSPALLNESNRKTIACGMTYAYGDNPIFNDSSIYYMVKEHKESGHISKLENR